MTKVLVTGADGFIGSHLTEMLLNQNYYVKALSQYNSFNNWGWLDGMAHPNLEVITGDVRDPHFCKHISRDVDIIFHLAALIAIPYSYVAPDSYIDTNIKGTLNICQAAKEFRTPNNVVIALPNYMTLLLVFAHFAKLSNLGIAPKNITTTKGGGFLN